MIPPTPPMLINAVEVGRLLGVSRKGVYDLIAQGALPGGIKLGAKLRRWDRGDLERWIAAGCPSAARWTTMRGGAR